MRVNFAAYSIGLAIGTWLVLGSSFVAAEEVITRRRKAQISAHAKLAKRRGERTAVEKMVQAQNIRSRKHGIAENRLKAAKQSEEDEVQERITALKNELFQMKVAAALNQTAAREVALETELSHVATVEEDLAETVDHLEHRQDDLATIAFYELAVGAIGFLGVVAAIIFLVTKKKCVAVATACEEASLCVGDDFSQSG